MTTTILYNSNDSGDSKDGGCDGKRMVGKGSLVMPSSGDVKIVVAFASQHGAVSISPSVTLTLDPKMSATPLCGLGTVGASHSLAITLLLAFLSFFRI